MNNLPSTVGGGGFHADGKLPRFRAVDFKARSELGPIEGSDIVDWPIDYDEMEPYYAHAENLVGVAGLAGANPFAEWRSGEYPMPPGADMFGAVLTTEAATPTRLQPVSRADRRELRARTTAGPRATTAGSADSSAARSTRRAIRSRRCATRCAPAAARSGRSRSSSGCCSIRPAATRAASATSTPTGNAHEVTAARRDRRVRCVGDAAAAAALGDRELLRSRRPLPHVPLPDVRGRLVPVPIARPSGPLGHAPARRPHDHRPREPRVREGARAPLLPRRNRRARRRRPPDHRGHVHRARARAHADDARLADARPAVGVHDPGRRSPAGDEPRRPRSARPRRARLPGRARAPTTSTRTRSSRRATTRPSSPRSCARPAPTRRSRSPRPGSTATAPRRIGASISRHIMGTCRMGDDPRTSVVDRWQRFHDVENMVCTDSSVFPTSTGYGPTLTIVALAIRACRELAGLPPLRSRPPI